MGYDVISIDDSSELPDADALVNMLPVGIKNTAVGTENAVFKQVARASVKTDRVVLDAVGAPLDLATATVGIRNVVRVNGRALCEVLVFLGTGEPVFWSRDE